MALNGSNDRPFSVDYCQLTCKLSSEMRDPSNVFKDAINELFQGCGKKISWHIFCLYLFGTLQIATDHGEQVPEKGRVVFFTQWLKDVYVIALRFDLPND